MDVVKTKISDLSGIIDVESTEGEGTLFTVTLPMTLAYSCAYREYRGTNLRITAEQCS